MKKYLDTKAESLESKITKIFGETVAKEGNKFTKALMAARDAGKKFFSVNGKQYETEAYSKVSEMAPAVAGIARAAAAGAGAEVAKKVMNSSKKHKKEDNTNDKSDDGEGMDKVQPKAVKKKFADRKDKDIDNDGDVDSSDKYLHKRRKAISKAVKKESVADIIQNKNYSMREALAKVWEASAHKNPFEMFGANTPSKPNQGAATVKRDQAAAAKARASGDKSNPGSFGKKKPISSQKKTDTGKPVTKVEINPKV